MPVIRVLAQARVGDRDQWQVQLTDPAQGPLDGGVLRPCPGPDPVLVVG